MNTIIQGKYLTISNKTGHNSVILNFILSHGRNAPGKGQTYYISGFEWNDLANYYVTYQTLKHAIINYLTIITITGYQIGKWKILILH